MLTPEQQVEVIIDTLDNGRMSFNGGYPSQYVIENGKIYWATLDARKEYNAPELVVRDLDGFIEDYRWVFDDREDEL
jgi:hypothetical protein